MANLGFVGLGVMGSQMVNRLIDKGHAYPAGGDVYFDGL